MYVLNREITTHQRSCLRRIFSIFEIRGVNVSFRETYCGPQVLARVFN